MKIDTNYRADIDGLRSIAVFIVIAYHAAFAGFTGGYVGVDVFFVISGYLITGLLFKEFEKTGTISLLSFYSKRFKRLFPALLFVMLTVILLWGAFFLDVPARTTMFIKSIRYSIFGFGNIFFKNNTGGYFDMASEEMPLLHFWSLAVEEQFYFVWPFLILVCSRMSFGFKSVRNRVIFVLSLLSLFSFCLTEYFLTHQLEKEAFYTMPARAWELGIGGLLYFIYPKFRELKLGTRNALGVIGLITILICTFMYKVDSRFPGVWALAPVIGTFLIILSGGDKKPLVDKMLSHRFLVKIGILSYGWYLWHWPLLAMAKVYFLGEIPPITWRISAVVLSLVLANVSLKLIESPVRFGKKINALRSGQVILGSLTISALVVLFSLGLKQLEAIYTPESYAQIAKFAEEKVTAQIGCDGSIESSIDRACVADYTNEETRDLPEIIVWGDSHATAYFPMFENFAKEKKIKVSLLSGSDMSPLLGVEKLYFSNKRETKNIGDQNNRIIENLKLRNRAKVPFSVALVSRWVNFTGAKKISVKDRLTYLDKSKTSLTSIRIMRESIRRTLQTLTDLGVQRVLIVLPTPEFKYDVLQCHSKIKCDTPLELFEKYRSGEVAIIKEESAAFKNVRLLDPVNTFCSNGNCPQIITNDKGQDIPTVEDDDHVSVQSALFLGRKEAAALEWIIFH